MIKKKKISKENLKGNAGSLLMQSTTYDFGKNLYIVEPSFKSANSASLCTVLIKLITQ